MERVLLTFALHEIVEHLKNGKHGQIAESATKFELDSISQDIKCQFDLVLVLGVNEIVLNCIEKSLLLC